MKLEGIKVIDLSLFLPGPHLTQMMCDHGAEVICVEPPPDGEPARAFGPLAGGHTPWFRNTHRGKKSICLNLKHEAARDALLRLCETADVFVEAFRPGVAQRLGLDYQQLYDINPRIVYCSISAFGQYGPYRDRPAHDLSVEALAGLVSVNLGGDGKPALPGVPAADMAASLMAFGGVMMALLRCRQSGRGDYIDISMQDALMGWTQNVIGPVFAEDRAPEVQWERGWGGRGFYRIYETADGRFLTLSGNEPKFVENLLNALQRPDLIELATGGPGPQQQPLIEFLQATFKQKSLRQWDEWFSALDVCYAGVLDLKQAFADEHVAQRDMRLSDADGNLHIGIPIKYSREPGRVDFAVPALNQHAEQILRSAGIDDRQLQQLRQCGALAAADPTGKE